LDGGKVARLAVFCFEPHQSGPPRFLAELARRNGRIAAGLEKPPQETRMSLTVSIDLGYEFDVKAKASEVFAVLSDVPTSVSHFPKVDKLTDMGGGVYKWEMEKVGTAQVNIQTVYASKYSSDKAKGTVTWTPVEGVGNALVGGHWKIKDNKKSTAIELKIEGDITLPLPGLMKMVVAPVVESEFEKLVDKYIANLIKKFGGEI
jgi:carbon monoxide dehydrogenase subunit G